jgi:hypothetical protein
MNRIHHGLATVTGSVRIASASGPRVFCGENDSLSILCDEFAKKSFTASGAVHVRSVNKISTRLPESIVDAPTFCLVDTPIFRPKGHRAKGELGDAQSAVA